MRRPLISAENSIFRNALGVTAAIVLVPVAILVAILTIPFARPLHRSASEVAQFLRDFTDGTGGDWDWDDFISIPIADPQLEAIRQRASKVPLGTGEAAEILAGLHAEAEEMAARSSSESLPS